MILDGLLTFTGTSQGASGGIASGPQTDLPTTGTQDASNIIDLGVLNGLPASAVNGGGARDLGIGDNRALKLSAILTVAMSAGTTITLELQGAPDAGSNTPGSYTVMWTSPAYAAANIPAGSQLANVDLPRVLAEQPLPRYLKLTFVTTSTNSTGLIEAQIVLDLDQQIMGATTLYSGYPAGVTVAN